MKKKLNDKIFNQIIYNIEFIRCCDVITFDFFEDGVYFNGCYSKNKDNQFTYNLHVNEVENELYQEQEEVILNRLYIEFGEDF